MTRIELEIHDDVVTAINKIKNIQDSGIELDIPEGSVLFENVLNLKLLKKEAEKLGLTVHFVTADEIGNSLLNMMEEKPDGTGFSYIESQEESGGFVKDSVLKKIKLPKIRFSNISLPKLFSGGTLKPFLILALIIFVLFAILKVGDNKRKAEIKIIVNSQPLTRSITIKVKADTDTSAENSILSGKKLETTTQEAKEADTTGEKTIGEKAKGTITIYNKTNNEIGLDTGDLVAYKDDDEDLVFSLTDGVTVPALTPQDPLDPGSVLLPGESEAEVEASDIGEQYNIENESALEFEEYKKIELTAEAKDDFEGGKSEQIKVVTQEDQTNLSTALLEEARKKAEEKLKDSVGKSQKLISGSTIALVSQEEFNHEVDDEADKLELKLTISAAGLAYSEEELNDLLDDLVDDLVPEGFVLSDKDREVGIEVLGNSTDSVLSSTEADIQVTLKAFIVPDIDPDDLKKELAGKSPQDAQKILGSVRNVKTYEFNMDKGLPFFQRIPSDFDKIEIKIERE